jgi:hypothetical protein
VEAIFGLQGGLFSSARALANCRNLCLVSPSFFHLQSSCSSGMDSKAGAPASCGDGANFLCRQQRKYVTNDDSINEDTVKSYGIHIEQLWS